MCSDLVEAWSAICTQTVDPEVLHMVLGRFRLQRAARLSEIKVFKGGKFNSSEVGLDKCQANMLGGTVSPHGVPNCLNKCK